jgi:hypothetical protein
MQNKVFRPGRGYNFKREKYDNVPKKWTDSTNHTEKQANDLKHEYFAFGLFTFGPEADENQLLFFFLSYLAMCHCYL